MKRVGIFYVLLVGVAALSGCSSEGLEDGEKIIDSGVNAQGDETSAVDDTDVGNNDGVEGGE